MSHDSSPIDVSHLECRDERRPVEGTARVVSVENGVAWFEPEQTTSCGHCASAAICGTGAKPIGGIAKRIELRRFPLDNAHHLSVGERVVVGVDERALIKASLTAYALPLTAALTAGGLAQGIYGSDLATMAAMAVGLAAGLAMSAVAARRMGVRGELSPRFLRRTDQSGVAP